jgi:hypothetical protein
LKEKKSILKMTEYSHQEIRKIQEEKEQLQTLLRVRERELDDIRFIRIAKQHRKGTLSQQFISESVR